MIIYKATNKVNGKSYIGQTVQKLSGRISAHKSRYKNHKWLFYNAIQKYGWDNFEWVVICECSSLDELNDMEFHYIKQYGDYNITEGGDTAPMLGKNHTEETRQQMSISHQGKASNMKGKKHTEETKRKISEGQMGENNQFFGRTHTKRTKDIIRKKMSGSNHPSSKKYRITFPDGKIEVVEGIRAFAREHGLRHQLLIAVAKGKQTHHKKYKCEYV